MLVRLFSKNGQKLQLDKVIPKVHKTKIIGLEVTHGLIISCGEEGDTHIRVWSLHGGDLLYSYDTSMVKNYDMTLSPDGRLLGVIAWISDIRLLEIETDKRSKEFKSVKLAMDLRGHSKGTLSLGFNPQGTNVVTSAKDGKLRHWNVAVQYELREDAKLIRTLDLPPDFPLADKLALSDKILCLASGSTLRFYDFAEFRLLDEVPQGHMSDIKKLRVFSHGGRQYVASMAQDGRVNIWKS
mmetsp:Transcript_17587/g.31718  ORF Transcript_17587/g.31718 Transcript_17587/m.31718 type:complete len:240 (-) Transcript_17587:3591-4310(-)